METKDSALLNGLVTSHHRKCAFVEFDLEERKAAAAHQPSYDSIIPYLRRCFNQAAGRPSAFRTLLGIYAETEPLISPERRLEMKQLAEAFSNVFPRRRLRKRSESARIRSSLRSRLSGRLRSCIRRGQMQVKVGRTYELIGCTPQQLVRHIERQFTKGMNWQNRHRWDIDHIRPCSQFDLNDPIQQRTCFHFTNLRPLWKKANLRKQAKRLFLI